MKIGIDIDGVIANFSKAFSLLLRDMYGNHLPIIENENEILYWDWEKWYPLEEPELYEKAFEEINKSDNFWMQVELINEEHWNRFVKCFNVPEHEVYFITSRTNGINLHHQTVEWLSYHGWKNPQVILSKQKHVIVDELKLDYFIDDNLSTLSSVSWYTDAKCYLYNYPHNAGYYFSDSRVNNLYDFTTIILSNEGLF